MNGRRAFVIVALALAIEGCGAAATSSSTSSPTTTLPSALPSPGAVSPSPSVLTSAPPAPTSTPPAPTPAPTLASTSTVATKAPKGAIPVVLTAIDPDHGLPVFQPDNLTAKAGTVVFFLQNVPPPWGSPDHNMWIGPSIGVPLAGSTDLKPKTNVIFTVKGLTPGSYMFWCTIAAPDGNTHASYGMKGTLTITP
jgi:plastocyanin